MRNTGTIHGGRSLYAAAWQHVGPGILVAMMFVILASASLYREQTAAANSTGMDPDGAAVFGPALGDLDSLTSGQAQLLNHSVKLRLPLEQLRDSHGRMTANGESLFLLLARRAKILSLSILLTTNSSDDAILAVAIATHMMHEGALDSTQVRISSNGRPAKIDPDASASELTVTITRYETVDGGLE